MNGKLIIKGVLAAFLGTLGSIVSWYIVPAFIDYLPTTVLQAISWVGLITVWILAIIVIPAFMILEGYKA